MSSNEQSNAFNEVRAILGKLDRSIDEARSRRLEPDQPARREPPTPPSKGTDTPSSAKADLDQEIGGTPAQRSMTELQKKSATFGRAKPLNRNNDRPSSAQWKTTDGDDEFIG